jgi:Co/Zn/Cd efflux system component
VGASLTASDTSSIWWLIARYYVGDHKPLAGASGHYRSDLGAQRIVVPSNSRWTVARAVGAVALANLAYFGVEFAVATAIGSVSLFADSIDFLEDAALNGLLLFGLRWTGRLRARLGMALALILLLPGVATLWTAWGAWRAGHVPAPVPLSITGLGALAVNSACAWTLAKVRHTHGSLTEAAFLSARNDVIANIAIIAAGGLTALSASRWPDLIVGLGIFAMNLDAARDVFTAVQSEHREGFLDRL